MSGMTLNDCRLEAIDASKEHNRVAFPERYPNKSINKGSKTTYADWCDKHGLRVERGSEEVISYLRRRLSTVSMSTSACAL